MKRVYYIISLMLVCSFAVSCDKDFNPAAEYTPLKLTPTMTIEQFKALYTDKPYVIEDKNIIVGGKVISSDREGNIYKSIYIQDASSGIELKIGNNAMYGDYPVGMTLYVKPQYLCLGNYRGMISLGFESSDAKYENAFIYAPELINRSILKGVKGSAVIPTEITEMSQLTSNRALLGTIVTIKNATFVRQTGLTTWAQPVDPNVDNSQGEYGQHTLNINGGSLIIRTSPYSSFAAKTTPESNKVVNVTAILTVFNTTYQLLLNNVTDVVVQ